MFDIGEARAALQLQRRELQAECEANSKLQRRFDSISAQLRSSTVTPVSADQATSDEDSTDPDNDDSRGDSDPSSDAWTDSVTSSQQSQSQSADQLDAMELLDQLGASLQATDSSSSSDSSGSGSGKGSNARSGNNNRRK